jgi:glycosyltransferase involved in cell wall biosynthesis
VLKIIFLSNLIKDKGILLFLDICEALKKVNVNFQATIVGKEFDVTVDQISGICKQKKINNNVKCEGALYGNEKLNVLIRQDVMILPTFNDAFPLVILEAMQFGVIPLASPIGGIPDMITDGKTGFLIHTTDIDKYVEKIVLLQDDSCLKDKMHNNCKYEFYKKYRIDIFEENFIRILNTAE